jgi:hypothetical protein
MDWSPGARRLTRLRVLASVVALGLIAVLLLTGRTWSAFSATTGNPANTAATGTVTLSDNDAGSATFALTDMTPGTSASSCIKVTYAGTLPALVHLYQTSGGSGLGSYLDLTITRGSISAGAFGDCTNFSADTTDYAGLGQGILYAGTLAGLGGTYAAGLSDPRTASIPEIWTASEVHAYKLTLSLRNNNSAQSATVTPTFSWEARNSSVYSDVILSDQPASYWKLDEAAGTTATDAMGAANGTYTNGPVINQTSGVKNADKAVSFDGVNDYVTFGDVYDETGVAPFSMELWLKPTTANQSTYRVILSKWSGGAGWALQIDPSTNRLEFARYAGGVNGQSVYSAGAVSFTTWSHVVVTYDGSTLKLYVNGTQDDSRSATHSLPNSAQATTLGGDPTAGQYLPGLLDEVAIYGYALSATQVTEHYDAGHM